MTPIREQQSAILEDLAMQVLDNSITVESFKINKPDAMDTEEEDTRRRILVMEFQIND